MIRPLRRRHRWIVPALFAALVIVAALALAHPSPSARMTVLPPQLVELRGR